KAFAEIRRFPAKATGAARASHLVSLSESFPTWWRLHHSNLDPIRRRSARRSHADKPLGSDAGASCVPCTLFHEEPNELRRTAQPRPNSLARPSGSSARRRLRHVGESGTRNARPDPDLPDPAPRRLPVARNGHVAIGLTDGSALVM